MVRRLFLLLGLSLIIPFAGQAADKWPDGSPISDWFRDVAPVKVSSLGQTCRLDQHGIKPGDVAQTADIQSLIDKTAQAGGGVIVVPRGTFVTGSLFFPRGVHLKLEAGATLKGSDDIGDYRLVETRIEGKSRLFFAALINVDRTDGFVLQGPGTIDGNGQKAWRSNWLRRRWNPSATNLDGQRARLLSVSHSSDVRIENVILKNPQMWTQHFWACRNVKLIGVTVRTPSEPQGFVGTCTDGIDFDNVQNALVKDCDIANWDDAISLKGGGGVFADDFKRFSDNGPVENVLIEDCRFGVTHGMLVVGSEAVCVRNVLMRRCTAENAFRVLWLKFRADTPQRYSHIAVEDVKGSAEWCFYVRRYADRRDWKETRPKSECFSRAERVTLRNIDLDCREFVDVVPVPDVYSLSDVLFENVNVRGEKTDCDASGIANLTLRNVVRSAGTWKAESHDDPDDFVRYFYGIGQGRSLAPDVSQARAIVAEAERRAKTPFATDCKGAPYLTVETLSNGGTAVLLNLERQYPAGIYVGLAPFPEELLKKTYDWQCVFEQKGVK